MRSFISSVWGRALVLAWVSSVLSAGAARAADEVWSTNAASGAWETGANWVSGNVPGSTADTANPDTAIFSGASATLTVLPDANRNLASLVFTNAKAGAYTIGTNTGNKLLLSNGGMVWAAKSVTNNETINAPVELEGDGGAYLFTNETAKTLTFGSPINGAATTGNVTSLQLAGTTNAGYGVLSGIVNDGPNGGKLAIVKNGSGGWYLSTNLNTYSGGTTLNGGTLRLAANVVSNPVNTCLGTGPLVINGGTLFNAAGTTITATNNMTWNGSFIANFPINANLSMGPGSVTLTTNVIVTIGSGWGALFVVPGPIGEAGGSWALTVSGQANPGYLNLSGSNTYSGGTTLNNGGIRIGNTRALGTGPLTINGGAIMQTSGNAVTGISGQTWKGDFGFSCTAGGINLGSSPVTVVGMRTISIDNGTATVGGNMSGAGGLKIQVTSYSSSLYLSGSNTFDGGITVVPVTNSTFTLNANNSWALGTGPLTFAPYTGLGGGISSVLRIDNSTTGALTLAANNAQYWSNNVTFVGTRSLNMGTGPVTLGTNNLIATVSANTLTLGGPIGDNGKGYPLTKAGAGTLALAGANTYTGLTTVAAGKLSLAVGGSLAGSVRVMTNATLELLTSSGIDDKATLQVDAVTVGSNTIYGVVSLTNGVVEVVSALAVGGTNYSNGTYGSTNSAAAHKFSGYFSGVGMVKVASPGTLLQLR